MDELEALIREGRVVMLGAIRQEVLSGVRRKEQFELLREKLRAFAGPRIDRTDYENAAACFNECRARGVQGGHVDMLICAAALRRDIAIFAADEDFRTTRRFSDSGFTCRADAPRPNVLAFSRKRQREGPKGRTAGDCQMQWRVGQASKSEHLLECLEDLRE